jgi:hypothetical protein
MSGRLNVKVELCPCPTWAVTNFFPREKKKGGADILTPAELRFFSCGHGTLVQYRHSILIA